LEAKVEDRTQALRQMYEALKQLYELACTHFTDLESLTARLLPSVTAILGVESAALGRIHGTTWQAVGVYGHASTAIEVGATLPLEQTFCSLVVRRGEPLAIPDAARDPELCHHPDYTELGTRAYVGIPLQVRGAVWGVLCGFDRAPKRFDDPGIYLMTLLTQHLAFEIERKAWEKELQAANEALGRITRLLTARLDAQQTLITIAETAVALVGDGVATIWLLEDETWLVQAAEAGARHPDHPARPVRLKIGEGIVGRIAQVKEPILIPDAQADPRFPAHPWLREEELHASAGFPLLLGDRCFGVFQVMRRGACPFGQEEVQLLQAFADQAAVAVQNSRLFQQITRGKQEWEATFDAIVEGIALLDEEGKVVRANRAFSALWEVCPDGLIGLSWHALADWLGLVTSPCPHCEAHRTKQPASVEAHLPQANRILAVTAFPMLSTGAEEPGSRGAPVPPSIQAPNPPSTLASCGGTVLIVRDITAERQTEQMVLLGRLVAGVAHELNTPLSVILGYAQLLLKKTDLTSEAHHDLTLIEKHARACRRIVDDLRQLTRPLPLQRERVDLNHLIQETLRTVKGSLTARKIEVVLALDPELPSLSVDPVRVSQVFTNLFTNAADAMPEGGTLTITTRVKSGVRLVEVGIADTGCGIPREHLHRIFDPLFTTKPTGKGIGLGLALAARIVKDHGGRIEVESEVGKGTTFRLLLPLESHHGAYPGR